MGRVAVAIIGGGVYAAKLGELLSLRLSRSDVELRLAARRQHRVDRIAGYLSDRVATHQPGWQVRSCRSPLEAVAGAAIVILMIRVGGLAARGHDEGFPTRFGLVGDEGIGVGGIANAWRTLPELETLADQLRQHAPRARVLNLIAPLGVTTRLLLEKGLDAVGVCELPLVTRRALVGDAAIDSLHSSLHSSLQYAGFNHLGWFWPRDSRGHRVLAKAVEAGLVDATVLTHFGAAPLHYYYEVVDPAAGQRLGRSRRPGRAAELSQLDTQLFRHIETAAGRAIPAFERRSTPWFDQALVPIVDALLGGPEYVGFANVRNGERVSGVPADVVIEVEASIGTAGVAAVSATRRPPLAVEHFVTELGRAEDLTYAAAAGRDRELLAAAIEALPVATAANQIEAIIGEIERPLGSGDVSEIAGDRA